MSYLRLIAQQIDRKTEYGEYSLFRNDQGLDCGLSQEGGGERERKTPPHPAPTPPRKRQKFGNLCGDRFHLCCNGGSGCHTYGSEPVNLSFFLFFLFFFFCFFFFCSSVFDHFKTHYRPGCCLASRCHPNDAESSAASCSLLPFLFRCSFLLPTFSGYVDGRCVDAVRGH